jgi:hypothetical protein
VNDPIALKGGDAMRRANSPHINARRYDGQECEGPTLVIWEIASAGRGEHRSQIKPEVKPEQERQLSLGQSARSRSCSVEKGIIELPRADSTGDSAIGLGQPSNCGQREILVSLD